MNWFCRSSRLVKFVFLVFLLYSCSGFGKEDPKYTITLNGKKPERLYVQSLKELGWEDDDRIILHLYQWTLVMDEEADYHFQSSTNDPGRLYLDIDGTKTLVAVNCGSSNKSKDAFDKLQPNDIPQLRGITLGGELSTNTLALLDHINPQHTYVSVYEKMCSRRKPTQPYPPINTKIKFLEATHGSSPNNMEYGYFSKMSDLEYLIFSPGADDVNYSWLTNCTELKFLDLSWEKIRNYSYLENLQDLRYLDLSRCKDLSTIEFVESLPDLRHLRIDITPVQDLRPIQDLEKIETVDAGTTGVSILPEKTVPSLVELRIMNSVVERDAVQTFSKLNPQCKIIYDWNSSLQSALEGVDRFRVRSGGTCHRNIDEEETLFETRDTSEIAQLINKIVIDAEKSNFHCGCCGNPTLEFYRNGELAVILGFHHSQSLRWAGGEWTGDGALTEDSQESLVRWFEEHGVNEPRKQFEENKKAAEEARIAQEKWMESMPSSIRQVWDQELYSWSSDTKLLASALLEQFSDKHDRILSLYGWYACTDDSWHSTYGYEKAPLLMLLEYELADLIHAIQSTQLSSAQLEGAARFFSRREFGKKWPKGLDAIPNSIKKKLYDNIKSTGEEDNIRDAKEAFLE